MVDGNTVTPIQRETPSSVEITRNSKGDYQWAVKCYAEVGDEARAMGEALSIDTLLRISLLGEKS